MSIDVLTIRVGRQWPDNATYNAIEVDEKVHRG